VNSYLNHYYAERDAKLAKRVADAATHAATLAAQNAERLAAPRPFSRLDLERARRWRIGAFATKRGLTMAKATDGWSFSIQPTMGAEGHSTAALFVIKRIAAGIVTTTSQPEATRLHRTMNAALIFVSRLIKARETGKPLVPRAKRGAAPQRPAAPSIAPEVPKARPADDLGSLEDVLQGIRGMLAKARAEKAAKAKAPNLPD
jgi:hypothetical protein